MAMTAAPAKHAVTTYAEQVLSGQIVAGRLVRLACARHLRDIETGSQRGLRFDARAAQRAIDFFPRFLRLAEGEFAGKQFELQLWQQFVVGSLFGWKGADDYRRFRKAYIESAKGSGKALALDTPLCTPDGWTTMGQIKTGDHVLDERGRLCTVLATSPTMHGRLCYRLTFDDGSQIVADAGHLWLTERRGIRTTDEIARTLRYANRRYQSANHSIPLSGDRRIISCEPVASVPVRCITVDSPSGLFLAGETMIPTHNSPLAAGIGLYGLVADGEAGAEVYAAAVTRDQAGILFRDACNMVKASPALASRIEVNVANLAFPQGNSFFRPVSSEARSLDGKRVHIALIDELHEHPNNLVVEKMQAGTKGRRQPLVIAITNSGYDRHSVCYQHHDYSTKVLEGIIEDDGWFAYVCQLDPCDTCRSEGKVSPSDGCPECDDWRDEQTWIKANPNLGISVSLRYYREQVREAEGMPAKANIVKRLNMCCWTEQDSRWLDIDLWDEGATPFDETELYGRPCYAGVDLSSNTDLTAAAFLFPPRNPDECWKVLLCYWIPEENVDARVRRDRVPYDVWIRDGYIQTTPGNVVDKDYIEAALLEDASHFQVQELAYDRLYADQMVQHLMAQGLTCVPFGMGFFHMAAPCKEFEALVQGCRLQHGGHPVMRWNASNVSVTQDSGGNRRPVKNEGTATKRIDGIVALLMALGRAMVHEGESGPSVYEQRGMLRVSLWDEDEGGVANADTD